MAFFFKYILVFILCLKTVPTPIQGQLILLATPCLVAHIPDENIEVGTTLRPISTAPVEEESFVPLCDDGDTCTPTGFIGKFKQQIPTDAFGLYVFRTQFRNSITKTDLGCGEVPLLVTKKFH